MSGNGSSRVITGLVPVISIGRTLCLSNRDGRDKSGHDNATELILPAVTRGYDWAALDSCASAFVSNTCGARLRSVSAAPSFMRMKALVV